MKKRVGKFAILYFLIAILLVVNLATIYYFIKTTESLDLKFNDSLNRIEILDKETRSSINQITSTLNSLSSAQENFQSQIGKLKATMSADFSSIIESEMKGVVTIKTDVSQGTGFLITEDGFVVTNYHVMHGAKAAAIYTHEGSKHSVFLFGKDELLDIALLKIEGEFSFLDFGDSDSMKVGEKVIAIGNPLGLSFTATEGIISARDRKGINSLPYYFQTDVSLNPGNSGGPLINTDGKVVGINNFKISGAENVGFALEINYAIDAINEIYLKKTNQSLF
jgi:S1-C subfamily serine protease